MIDVVAIAVAACLAVESRNGADVRTGDGGRAVGHYQLWPVAVSEANRIEAIYARRYSRPARQWTLADRRCPERSRQMCELTLMWHYRRGVRDPVALACRWRNPKGDVPRWHRRKVVEAVRKERAV